MRELLPEWLGMFLEPVENQTRSKQSVDNLRGRPLVLDRARSELAGRTQSSVGRLGEITLADWLLGEVPAALGVDLKDAGLHIPHPESGGYFAQQPIGKRDFPQSA